MLYPDILQSDETRAFWAYFETLCARSRPPRADDLELMDIYHLAPIITLLDYLPDEQRLRVRYAGTRIVEMFDQETTGLYIDEIDLGMHAEALVGVYLKAAAEVAPYWSLGNVELERDEGYGYKRVIAFDYERLMFPMIDAGGNVVRIASILVRHGANSVDGGFACQALSFPQAAKAPGGAAANLC